MALARSQEYRSNKMLIESKKSAGKNVSKDFHSQVLFWRFSKTYNGHQYSHSVIPYIFFLPFSNN